MTESPAWTKSYWWKALSIGMALLGLASIFPAILATTFIFDSPSASVFFVAAGLMALPFLCFASAVLPYKFKRRPRARLIFLVPLLDVLLMPILWWTAALLSGPGSGGDLFRHTFDGPCENFNIDDLPSPSGQLLIDRSENRCALDEMTIPLLFSLRQPGAPFDKGRAFASTIGEGANRSPLTVISRWIDDTHIIVATPEGTTLKTAQNDFEGIHIQYATYPLESTRTRDENLTRKVVKDVVFESIFNKTSGVGSPGVGCNLEASAYDGKYIDKLEVALSARIQFPTEGWNGHKLVKNKAYSAFDFQVIARDKIDRPGRHATGADIVGFTPKDDKSRLWSYDAGYPQSKSIDDNPRPKWYFAYAPSDPNDLISIAEQLRTGSLTVRTGYFLDNEIVVYKGGASNDQGPIRKFEKCIAENHIFDTPQFGGSR